MKLDFLQDGGCLLTDDSSFLKAAPFKYSGTVTGPKFCPGAVQDKSGRIRDWEAVLLFLGALKGNIETPLVPQKRPLLVIVKAVYFFIFLLSFCAWHWGNSDSNDAMLSFFIVCDSHPRFDGNFAAKNRWISPETHCSMNR